MVTFDQEWPQDFAEIDALLDAAFGPERSEKSSNILRESNPALAAFSRVIRMAGHIVATVRFTPVHVHDPLLGAHANALFLGPLAVRPDMQSGGLGSKLMEHALKVVDAAGYETIILVGDAEYYGRFGFEAVLPRIITMPGGRDASRLLVRQLECARPLPVLGTIMPYWVCDPGHTPALLPAA